MAKGEIVPGNAAAPAADDSDAGDRDEGAIVAGGKSPRLPVKSDQAGFFTIYKKGQGKWTRLGTAFAAGGLACLTAYNLYQLVLPRLPMEHPDAARKALLVGCALFLAGFGVLTFWLSNKPGNVDFLIATDSEMKKVNWTTKGELMGSTRVVVLFLVFICVFLFAVDLVFAKFFHLIRVLQ